jgi:two-component system NtrC family sensor kinase
VLPRALLYSPYPDPLLRPFLFVAFATLISLLLALQLNRIEQERRAHAELSAAYQKLKKYHQQLKESQEQLVQAEKLSSLGQLAASVAHEVNNPLAGILAYTQLLLRKIDADDIDKDVALNYLTKIERETTHGSKLIRNLLDFSRQSPLTLNEVNINEVVNRAFDLVAHLAESHNIQVIKKLSPSLPKLIADFGQLQQVFTNIILNAIQAMPQGGKLTIQTSASDNQVKVAVKDTGCGISPENMRKLFTPFYTTKEEVKGVGLGLAVAYGIIKCHHGTIEVQSKEGKGTIFTIKLPLSLGEEEERNIISGI